MEMVVKFELLGLFIAVIGLQLKGIKSEYGIYIGFACAIVILFHLLIYLKNGLQMLDSLLNGQDDYEIYYQSMLKILGITYICEFCASICKEAGYIAVANQIEVFGKISILIMAIPIAKALFDVLGGFL